MWGWGVSAQYGVRLKLVDLYLLIFCIHCQGLPLSLTFPVSKMEIIPVAFTYQLIHNGVYVLKYGCKLSSWWHCHLCWDRVWQSVLNYFRLSGQESFSVSWYLNRILNRSIQPSKGLRIDILEKDTKACMTLISKAWMAKQVALMGVIQTQWEKRRAAGGKSDRSVGWGGR